MVDLSILNRRRGVSCASITRPTTRVGEAEARKDNLRIPDGHSEFGTPGQIDVLLSLNMLVEVLLHDPRVSPPNAPVAIETKFGWIIAGATNTQDREVVSCHSHIR